MSRLVSIIVPSYNAARWLAPTLESALAQTWPEVEIIVVDDGSTDDSRAIAARFAGDRLRVIAQANAGAAAARNTGLRVARGDYVQFLDADDVLAPDKIARQMARLAGGPSRAIASGPWASFALAPAEAQFRAEPVWADFAPLDWLVTAWAGAWMFPPIVWLAPRAILTAAGPWDERLSLDDDGEYFCRVLLAAEQVAFVEDARSFYRRHDGPRVSRGRGAKAAQSSFRSNEQKERLGLAAENSSRMRHALACNWQRFAWEQLADAPELARQALGRSRELDPALPRPDGPRAYRLASHVLGWKLARRAQLAAQRLLSR